MLTAQQLYEAGQLQDAIKAMNEEVKKKPADIELRGFLCTLLCLAGNLERADMQLDMIGTQEPKAMVGISLWRQLIRAEQARQQFYADGRLPEFIEQPTDALKLHLEASIQLRDGNPAEAAKLLAQAEEQRPDVKGVCNDEPFEVFRDLDDLTSSFIEVLTSTGKYYWIPTERVESIEIQPPERPRDLLWLQAQMTVQGGPDGIVYLPTIYAGAYEEGDDKFRLGRASDWTSAEGEPVRGKGLRTFLVGDKDPTILELKTITINT